MQALLPGLAFAAVFTAGVFSRSLWQHERDLWRASRTAAARPRTPSLAAAVEPDSDAFGTPYRYGADDRPPT